MASSWGWWTLPASSSTNVIACSSVVLVLSDRSWTFCTTFRYIFLDLGDWPAELPPIITLISPSGGCDDSYLPFQLLILMLSSKEISQLSLSNKIFNQLFQIVTFICIMPMVSMEAVILIPISPATSRKDHPWFAWELAQGACSMACIVDSMPKGLPSCYLGHSYLPFIPSLDGDLARSGAWGLLPFSQLSSFS